MGMVKESALEKALDELEEAAARVEKSGDPLLSADPEGGMPKQGKPLSNQVPKGSGKISKKMSASDRSSSDDDEAEKAEKPTKTVSKAASSSSSDDDDEDAAEKSFIERAEDDEAMQKGFQANEFLTSMTSTISATIEDLRKSTRDELEAIRKSEADFRPRLAKSIVAIADALERLNGAVAGIQKKVDGMSGGLNKALMAPNLGLGRPIVTSARDVVEPNLAEGEGSEMPLDGVDSRRIGDWLFDNLQGGNLVKSHHIEKWEHARYDPRALPSHIRNALEQEFCK